MKKLLFVMAFILFLGGCASDNYNKEIPIHAISLGMTKAEVVAKLGNPHRVVASEVVNGVNRQTWMYQQDKLVWLSGNSFLGGMTRNDQIIYLMGFEGDKLVAWKDNQLQKPTSSENTFELRSR